MNPHGRKGSTAAGQNELFENGQRTSSQNPKLDKVFGQPRKSTRMFRPGFYARVSSHEEQAIAEPALFAELEREICESAL